MSPAQRLDRFSPIFPVRDLDRALAHYAALGFDTHGSGGGERYGFAGRDGVSLHLAEVHEHHHDHGEEHDHAFAPGMAYLYVQDADALAAEWSREGIGGRTLEPCDRPYGLREGGHLDPDGNLIRFGSPLEGVSRGVSPTP